MKFDLDIQFFSGKYVGSEALTELVSKTKEYVNDGLSNKVDKVTGKGLSTEDYTTSEKNKLANVESGAQANVQSDWNATSGDAKILNKPTLATVATSGSYNDLSNKPTIPTTLDDISDGSTRKLSNYVTLNGDNTGSGSLSYESNETREDVAYRVGSYLAQDGYLGAYARNLSTNAQYGLNIDATGFTYNDTEGSGHTCGLSFGNSGTIAVTSDIPTNNNQLTNGAGYITSSGSCNYATSAGSAPASDVYSWAKASTKPSYSWSEISSKPSFATVATSGSYNDLSNKPTIPDISGKLDKTTYEWNKEISFGQSGYLLIGKFPMYDSNITVYIDSTTSNTYHGVLVLATQNINTSRGGDYSAVVYGDSSNTVAPSLKIKYSSGSNVFELYFAPQSWSKNLIHIKAVALAGSPTNICENVDSVPSSDLIDVTNSLTTKFFSNAGANPNCGDGTVITQPAGNAPVSIRTTQGSSRDVGILMLSEDCSYICNSSDNTYSFAVWDTDLTQDFSASNVDAASFVVLEGGNGLKTRGNTVIHSGNIGSQSVNYANSAGSVAWSNVSGKPSIPSGSDYIERLAWWNEGDSHNVDDLTSGTTFAYTTHGAPTTGTIVAFSCTNGNYQLQLQGNYYSNKLYFRNKNGDNATWNSWNEIIHGGNIGSQSVNYATSAGSAGSVAWSNVSGRPTNVSSFTNDSGYVTSSGTVAKAIKAETADYAEDVEWGNVTGRPKNLSQFTNDSGYITSSGSCSYATSAGSAPASDVYSWAKASSKPSYDFSEIGAGTISMGDGANYFKYRTNSDLEAGFYYHNSGDESVVFANKYDGAGWIFVNGIKPSDRTDWQNLTPTLQIKRGGVAINKLIGQATTPYYKLDVNGSINGTYIYKNGSAVTTLAEVNSAISSAIDDALNGSY